MRRGYPGSDVAQPVPNGRAVAAEWVSCVSSHLANASAKRYSSLGTLRRAQTRAVQTESVTVTKCDSFREVINSRGRSGEEEEKQVLTDRIRSKIFVCHSSSTTTTMLP